MAIQYLVAVWNLRRDCIKNMSTKITQFHSVLYITIFHISKWAYSNKQIAAINLRYFGFLSNLIHFQHPRMCPDFHQILVISENASSLQRHSCKIDNIGRERRLIKIFLIQFNLNFRQSDADDIFMLWWQKLCQCWVIFSLNRTIPAHEKQIISSVTGVTWQL